MQILMRNHKQALFIIISLSSESSYQFNKNTIFNLQMEFAHISTQNEQKKMSWFMFSFD